MSDKETQIAIAMEKAQKLWDEKHKERADQMFESLHEKRTNNYKPGRTPKWKVAKAFKKVYG